MKSTMMKRWMNRVLELAAVVGITLLLTSNFSNGSENRHRFYKIPTSPLNKHSKTTLGKEAVAKNFSDPYLLAYCIVTGAKIGSMGDAVIYEHQGREIRFCCPACVDTFKKSPEEFLKKIDAEIIQQQLPAYPVDTCPVTGNKLGEMGDPVNIVYRNRLVRLCCNGCVKEFEKSPAQYLEKLDKAVIEKQKTTYPFGTCIVTGKKLGSMGEPVDYIVGNQLMRLCCNACVTAIQKEPAKFMARVNH